MKVRSYTSKVIIILIKIHERSSLEDQRPPKVPIGTCLKSYIILTLRLQAMTDHEQQRVW